MSKNYNSQRIKDPKYLKKENEIYNIKFQNMFVIESSKQRVNFQLEQYFGNRSNSGNYVLEENENDKLMNEMTVKQRIEFQVYFYLY